MRLKIQGDQFCSSPHFTSLLTGPGSRLTRVCSVHTGNARHCSHCVGMRLRCNAQPDSDTSGLLSVVANLLTRANLLCCFI